MKEIDLNLTIDEANLVLEGLGTLPFARVYALVAKIQEQAARQVRPAGSVPESAAPGLREATSNAPVSRIEKPDGE